MKMIRSRLLTIQRAGKRQQAVPLGSLHYRSKALCNGNWLTMPTALIVRTMASNAGLIQINRLTRKATGGIFSTSKPGSKPDSSGYNFINKIALTIVSMVAEAVQIRNARCTVVRSA